MAGHLSPRMFALCGFVVLLSVYLSVFMAAPFGIGVSPDSVDYLSAAASLLEDGEFRNYTGDPYVHWPPLLPAMLALADYLGFDPVATAPHVQGFFVGLTAALSLLLVFDLSRSWALAGAVGLIVALSTLMAQLTSWLSAEPVFAFLVLATTFLTIHYLRRPSLTRLIAIGATCALAFLARYAAGSLLVAASAAILIYGDAALRRRVCHALALWPMALLPVGLWLVRNAIVTGTPTGERAFSPDKFPGVLESVLRELGTWFIPAGLDQAAYVAGGSLILLAAAGFGVLGTKARRGTITRELAVLSVFVLVYSLFTVYALLTACCVLRFMAPIHPVLLVFAVGVATVVWRALATKGTLLRVGGRAALVGAFLLVVFMNVAGTSVVAHRSRDEGLGYSARGWQQNAVLEYLEAQSLENACIFTNAPDAVWYFLRPECLRYGPRKGVLYHENISVDDRPQVIAEMKAVPGELLFVWFEGMRTDEIRPPEALSEAFRLDELLRSEDGAVFRLRTKG